MNTKNKGNVAPGAATKTETKAETATISNPKIELSQVTIGPRKEEQPPQAETTPQPPQEPKPKPLTIEQRRAKAELFEILLNKHDLAQAAKQKMDAFLIGADDNSQAITLKDKNNNSFSTGNPAIMEMCIEVIKNHIHKQCGTIEMEIMDFII
jgi:hypothetical protein